MLVWTVFRVNYVFIFEFDARNHIRYQHMLEVISCASVVVLPVEAVANINSLSLFFVVLFYDDHYYLLVSLLLGRFSVHCAVAFQFFDLPRWFICVYFWV